MPDLKQPGHFFRGRGFLAPLVLISLAGLGTAAGPYPDDPTSVQPDTKTSPDKKAPTPPVIPGGYPSSPLVFNEEMWGNLVDGQNAYLVRLGEMGQDPPGKLFQVFADAGFFMLQTYYSRPNPPFVINGNATPATPPAKFDFPMNFPPVVNLGAVTEDGWGVRGSWQQLDENTFIPRFLSNNPNSSVSSVPISGLPGFTAPGPLDKSLQIFNDKVNFSTDVRYAIFDAEVFKEFRRDPWSLVVGGGVRYLYLSQWYDAFRINSGTAKTTTTLKLIQDSERVDSGRNFGGVGPYSSTELRYRVGRLPIWLYCAANGALLFGRQEIESFENTTLNLQTTVKTGAVSKTTSSLTTSVIESTSATTKTLTVADFEAGADMAVPYGRVLLLLRAGVAEQIFFDGGNATSAAGNVAFFGLRFTAGVSF
jgi:hypothetical protein